MSKTIQLFIKGTIGKIEELDGSFSDGIELVDVVQQVHPAAEFDTVNVFIESPGGLVDVGNQIYDFLISLRNKGKTVNTFSIGNVGSIATKIFMAGQQREIRPQDDFFIHNPWMDAGAGDANNLEQSVAILREEEKKLRDFYIQQTGLNEEAIKPFMDEEKALSADEALNLGFATRISEQKEFKAVAYRRDPKQQSTKQQSTSAQKEEKTFIQKIALEVNKILKPKSENTMSNSKVLAVIKARILVTTEAGELWVDAEDINNIQGAAITTVVDGQPTTEAPPDGTYNIEETGMSFVVEAGVVKSVTDPASADGDGDGDAQNPEFEGRMKAIEDGLQVITDSLDAINDNVEKQINDFKQEVVTGKAPIAGNMNANVSGDKKKPSAIRQKMNEIKEKQKEKKLQ